MNTPNPTLSINDRRRESREIQLMPVTGIWFFTVNGEYVGESRNAVFAHLWVKGKTMKTGE